jgi:hypothetical protein
MGWCNLILRIALGAAAAGGVSGLKMDPARSANSFENTRAK